MSFNNTIAIDKIIGKQLREKRIKRGLTLSAVANEIGVSYQQIQKYESAVSKISASALYQLTLLYGIGIEKFFEGLPGANLPSKNISNGLLRQSERKVLNLLIVEDNPGDEAITRRALSDFKDINILCVHDGAQTMEVLRYKTLCSDFPRPDLIFLDMYLPRRDGLTILKEIKRDRDIQDIPIVILTNNISADLMSLAYKNGASGYICKSFDFMAFKESITDCIKYWSQAVVLPSEG